MSEIRRRRRCQRRFVRADGDAVVLIGPMLDRGGGGWGSRVGGGRGCLGVPGVSQIGRGGLGMEGGSGREDLGVGWGSMLEGDDVGVGCSGSC